MIAGWLGFAAWAAPAVTVTDGALWPGRAGWIEVASLTDRGEPAARAPEVTGDGVVDGPVAVRPGVWRWQVVPPVGAQLSVLGLRPAELSVLGLRPAELDRSAGSHPAEFLALEVDGEARPLPISAPPPSRLSVPAQVDVAAGAGEVVFVLPGLVAPDEVEITPGEGRVASVTPTEGGLEVHLALDDRPYPRWIPVAVRETRRSEAPAWVGVRVRARPRIPLVAEPGARMTLRVGGRSYGPFEAGADGALEGRVDQYPGEDSASAVLVDDLGNETRAEIPLIGAPGPSIALAAAGTVLPGRRPPVLYLRVVEPGGGAPPVAPTCRTARVPLALQPLDDRTWLVPLPDSTEDHRVTCTAGAATADARVPVASGVPTHLGLRVWPDQLAADVPTAEIAVVVEDARGERLAVGEAVSVVADRGSVHLRPGDGIVATADYDGAAAASMGADRVVAEYRAPTGSGPVEELVFGWGAVPARDGPLVVQVRALDAQRRPLPDREVALTVGGAVARARTGADGWGRVDVPMRAQGRPVELTAASEAAEARALVLPGEAAWGGPGAPDLTVSRSLTLAAGRVKGISVEVDPTLLRAGPGAIAWVYVRLEDGAGQVVTDEVVTLEASEGSVGEARLRPDGTWMAEYAPLPDERAREVEITASTTSVHSSAHLALEPRMVRMSFGPWIGAQTNFGSLSAPTAGFDFDARLRSKLIGEAVIVRLGVAGTSLRSTADTGVGPPVDLRSTLVPLTAGLLLRQDRGPWGLWGGGGALVGAQVSQVRFGGSLVSRGASWLVGGMITGGAGVRAPGGELVFQLQGSWLPAPGADVGYAGNLGSLTGGLGYRLVY